MSEKTTDLCYPILTPFKFQGVVVKPPAFIQLSDEEAEPLIAAGVIGGDAALPIEEAIAASIEMAQTQNTTTTESTTQVAANPAGGAPPAGSAKPARVVRNTTARKRQA